MGIKSKILKTTAITAVTLSGVLTAGLFYLHTQSGLDMLSRTVQRVTANTDMPITVGKLSGSLFYNLQIDAFTVSDPYGVWLKGEDIRVSWSPLALITGDRVVRLLGASKIEIDRLPDMPASQDKDDDKANSDPALLSLEAINRFLPRQLDIHHIHVGSVVTRSTDQALSLYGAGRGKAYVMELATLKGPQTELRLSTWLNNRQPQLHLRVHEQAGGVLSGLLKLPTDTTISGQLKLETEGRNLIRLSETDFTIGSMSLTADGIYQKRQKHLGLQAALDIPDIGVLSELAQKPLSGAVKVHAHAEGALDSMVTGGDVTLSDLSVDQQIIPAVTIEVQSVLDLVSSSFDAQITHTPIDVAPYGFDGKVTLDIAAKGTPDYIESSAKLLIDTAQGQSVLDAQAILNIAEQDYQGQTHGVLVHGADKFDLATQFAWQGQQKLDVPTLLLKGPGVDISGAFKADLVRYQADGQLAFYVDDMQPLARFLQQDMKGRVKADLIFAHPDSTQQLDVNLDALSLDVASQKIRLQEATSLLWRDQHLVLKPTRLSINGSVIRAQADMSADKVEAQLRATRFNFAPFVPQLTEGQADIALDIAGQADQPIMDLKTKGHLRGYDMPLQFDVTAHWQNQDLRIKADTKSHEAVIKAHANLVSSLSLMPFKTDISEQTPVSGRISAALPLESLNPFLWPMGHRVTGQMNGRFTVGGRVGQPVVNGETSLKGATYDHVMTGICLRNLDTTIRVTQDHVTVQSLSAKDEDGKILSARFRAGLTGAQTMDGALALDHFRLFCGGLATGQIDGAIRVTGVLRNMHVGGKLTLGPLNVQLPGAQHESKIPSVKTVRVRQGKMAEDPPTKVTLDIMLDAPQQVFIRGRGLDAEFGGALTITGQASAPVVAGKFASRRGTFNFLDRVLSLTKGELNFAGPIPPSPILNIDTQTKVRGTSLHVGLQGSVTAPKLTLSSQPALPQDEILALLLFGRQLQAISPFEALKLAQATRTLAGLDGGEPGILDRARDMLGLDVLSISTSDNNEVTISTGKYVTDKVFVGVQQGNKPEDKLIKTEIELTPTLSANTTMDGNANQGFGMNWRYDY